MNKKDLIQTLSETNGLSNFEANRIVNMKRIYAIVFISLAFVFLFNLNTFAQIDNAEHISIILPTESIAKFVTKLLPYEINRGYIIRSL